MSKTLPTVQRFMTTAPTTIEAKESIATARDLMSKNSIRHLPVVIDGALHGVISDRDIRLALSYVGSDPQVMTVKDIATDHPYCASPDTPLDEVADNMAEKHIGCAIIAQNDHIVGIFTTIDACKALSDVLHQRWHQH